MKLLRISAIFVLLLVLLAAGGVASILANQQKIIGYLMTEVARRTGVEIKPASSWFAFRNHLILVLDKPRFFSNKRELATMDVVRLVISYHSLIYARGLPLYRVVLDHPRLSLPYEASELGAGVMPAPDAATIGMVLDQLTRLSRLAWRLDVIGLSLRDASGLPIAKSLELVAFHRRSVPGLWMVSLEGEATYPWFKGAHFAMRLAVGRGPVMREHEVLKGGLLFWNVPLQRIPINGIDASATANGRLQLSLHDDATAGGRAEVGFRGAKLAGLELNFPLDLGDYTVESAFAASDKLVALTGATVRRGNEPVAAGQVRIEYPGARNPGIVFDISGVRTDWAAIARIMRALRRLPSEAAPFLEHIQSGKLQVQSASMRSSLLALRALTFETLLRQLNISAALDHVSFSPPDRLGLPMVSGLALQLRYSRGVLLATQGTANLQDSKLSNIRGRLVADNRFTRAEGEASFDADVDVGQLQPALTRALETLGIPERNRLRQLTGRASAQATLSGVWQEGGAFMPQSYRARFEPHQLTFEVKDAPGAVTFESGTVTLEPDRLEIARLTAVATGGSAVFDGNLSFRGGELATRGITVTVHQMPVEPWLGLAVPPDKFSASGTFGGQVVVVTAGHNHGVAVNGKLTMVASEVQFNFMRSPMRALVATVSLARHSLVFSMPNCTLEGEPLDFKVTIVDLRNPDVRIDALAEKLDLESMKFVRMPWTPPTPPIRVPVPVSGHLEARKAILEKLVMSGVNADFNYYDRAWRIYHFTSQELGGQSTLELVGRREDDWIHITGKADDLDVGQLFLLKEGINRPPLVGRLSVTPDLWADTRGNFFETLNGTMPVKVRNGTLRKFVLLSRLLGFVDLKTWLTANMPDPNVAGVQFDTIDADFEGKDGVFHTENLALKGPVMQIAAAGNVNVATSRIDMKLAMFPFNTVTWLMSKVPLIGGHLAGGTGGLVAAYFHVTGPIDDPAVVPAPLTSVAELIKKTLGLPVNLIEPNTIR